MRPENELDFGNIFMHFSIDKMNSEKAPGKDKIPAKLYKALNADALKAFHEILTSILNEEEMLPDLRDTTMVALYKNKGTIADCGNYRGISFFSIAGKILAHIILNRLIASVSEENLQESQCVFHPNRSTVNMIFAVRQVQRSIYLFINWDLTPS